MIPINGTNIIVHAPVILSSSARGVELCEVALTRSVDVHLLVDVILPEESESRKMKRVHLLTLGQV